MTHEVDKNESLRNSRRASSSTLSLHSVKSEMTTEFRPPVMMMMMMPTMTPIIGIPSSFSNSQYQKWLSEWGNHVNYETEKNIGDETDKFPKALEEKKESSFLDKLKFWKGFENLKVKTESPKSPKYIIEEINDEDSICSNETCASVVGSKLSITNQQKRWKNTGTPLNTVLMFVPQQEAWIVERMGKFSRILDPGLNVLIPILDKVKYVQNLKEMAIDIPQQTAISMDNVTINIDGVLYLKVVDAYKASYGVDDPEFAITQLAQTTMRSEIGKITLDMLFKERESLNLAIVMQINQAADAWGISCMRYEIRDIRMPARVQEAMQMQVEAERKKRASILESEGTKAAEINIAEGKKQARILSSEAEKQELINAAQGNAQAVIASGKARAESIHIISQALCSVNGGNAANLTVAEQYVSAFGQLAQTNNTLILPANTGDISSMVAQAMSIYKNLERKEPEGINPLLLEETEEDKKKDLNQTEENDTKENDQR